MLTVLNNIFNKYFLGIHLKDVNWIKVYSGEQLLNLNLQLNSSLIESEICAKLMKSGYQAIEISSEYHPRVGGASKGGSWKTVRKALNEMWCLYSEVKNFK